MAVRGSSLALPDLPPLPACPPGPSSRTTTTTTSLSSSCCIPPALGCIPGGAAALVRPGSPVWGLGREKGARGGPRSLEQQHPASLQHST